MQDIFETLGEVGTTYDQAVNKLDSHFDIKKNITFENVYFMKQAKKQERT